MTKAAIVLFGGQNIPIFVRCATSTVSKGGQACRMFFADGFCNWRRAQSRSRPCLALHQAGRILTGRFTSLSALRPVDLTTSVRASWANGYPTTLALNSLSKTVQAPEAI
jgi:hypothetical protein